MTGNMTGAMIGGEFSGQTHEDSEVRTALIRGATFDFRAVEYYVRDNVAVFEEDILPGKADGVERETQEILAQWNEKRAIVRVGNQYRWPQGIVPYIIDPALGMLSA